MKQLLRRGSALVLALVLLLCAAPLSPAARAFSDSSPWAADYMDKATQYGLMQGYPDGSFGVGKTLTRGEFVTILCRLFAWETVVANTASFSDCPLDKWYTPAVETALAHGVMESGGTFRPAAYISREEMAVMLVRALGYDRLAQSLSALSLPFDDVKSNTGYIAIAYDIGMIGGVSKNGQLKFLPSTSAKREEAAAMLVRVYERYTAKTDFLHGFYAFSSYGQIGMTAAMDGVSVGWSQMEYTAARGAFLNATAASGNDWVRPDDVTPATTVFDGNSTPYNLNVFASATDKITLADGSQSSTVSAVTSTAAARAQAVAALVSAVPDYAGITIDFEGMKGDTLKRDFVTFMTELRAALPTGKTLYVCVQPDTWYTGFDYRGLGAVCDKVILMAHDYQSSTVPDSYVGTDKTDNPVTPFPEIYQALRDITDPVIGVQDRSKIALAISFGTAGFKVDESGKLLETTIYHPAPDVLAGRLNQPSTTVTYSDRFRNPMANYTTEDGSRYLVWYENEQSVLDKIQLASMFGINGISLWRLGTVPNAAGYDVWSALLTRR